MTLRRALILAASLFAPLGALAADATERVEINVFNNRAEDVVMKFEYAFREYKWKMMEHKIASGDDVIYRFPANIPGCEKLREWRITDGVLSLWNTRGLVCEKRISLCDKVTMTMIARENASHWSGSR